MKLKKSYLLIIAFVLTCRDLVSGEILRFSLTTGKIIWLISISALFWRLILYFVISLLISLFIIFLYKKISKLIK